MPSFASFDFDYVKLKETELRDVCVVLNVKLYGILLRNCNFYRPSAPRRSELSVNMEPVTVLHSVNPSRRWKSHSTPSTIALSAER